MIKVSAYKIPSMKKAKVTYNPYKLTKTQNIVLAFINLLALLTIISCMFAVLELANKNIGWGVLFIFIPFSTFGAFIAYLLSKFLANNFAFLKQELNKKKSNISMGIYSGFIFLTPTIAHYVNRTASSQEEQCKTYIVIDKGENTYRGHTYFLYIKYGFFKEQLYVKKEIWDKVEIQGNIEVCTKEGKLKVDYLTKIRNV